MSCGKFFVSLREVEGSEKILNCHSLLEVEHNYWLNNEEYGENEVLGEKTDKLLATLEEKKEEIFEPTVSSESEEVAHYIADNITMRIHQATKCKICEAKLIDTDVEIGIMRSFNLFDLSRVGLAVLSKEVLRFVASRYAL